MLIAPIDAGSLWGSRQGGAPIGSWARLVAAATAAAVAVRHL